MRLTGSKTISIFTLNGFKFLTSAAKRGVSLKHIVVVESSASFNILFKIKESVPLLLATK